jgi:UDP-glucose 4-epimerase
MHHFITGIAGFIGSQLADALLRDGAKVSGVDDFSLGRSEYLVEANCFTQFKFLRCDVSRLKEAADILRAVSEWGGAPDIIWHFAANSDIAAGMADASIDFKRTLQTTHVILESAKVVGTKKIAFASTSAVYGERDGLLTENSGPLLPISNYGATKLASEVLLSAAAESFLERLWIFRFPNVVGARATHGAIFDFVARLAKKSNNLMVLGDGTQTKPYIHVTELIDAMKYIVSHASSRRNVFNIAPSEGATSVAFIAEQVIARMRPGTPIAYTGGDRGWVGVVPRFRYSTEHLTQLGWKPRLTSNQAVLRAIEEIASAADCSTRH